MAIAERLKALLERPGKHSQVAARPGAPSLDSARRGYVVPSAPADFGLQILPRTVPAGAPNIWRRKAMRARTYPATRRPCAHSFKLSMGCGCPQTSVGSHSESEGYSESLRVGVTPSRSHSESEGHLSSLTLSLHCNFKFSLSVQQFRPSST
jgi:hypothetical protein